MSESKEQVYDEQINPLMAQIIAICKEHKIAMLADFHLGFEDDEEGLKCTSAQLQDEFEPGEEQIRALDILLRRPVELHAFTITTKGKN